MYDSGNTDYREYYEQYISRLKEKAKVAVADALEKTWADFFLVAESDIKKIFNDAIQDFYNSYSPTYYTRNESLYNILETDVSSTSIKISFNPENMTGFRSGYRGEDGLYDQVFRQGWHGGAGSISDDKALTYGAHPEPGTPFWRTPVPYFTRWGNPAAVSTPPLEDIRARIAQYQALEMQSHFNNVWNKYKSKIRIR